MLAIASSHAHREWNIKRHSCTYERLDRHQRQRTLTYRLFTQTFASHPPLTFRPFCISFFCRAFLSITISCTKLRSILISLSRCSLHLTHFFYHVPSFLANYFYFTAGPALYNAPIPLIFPCFYACAVCILLSPRIPTCDVRVVLSPFLLSVLLASRIYLFLVTPWVLCSLTHILLSPR